MGGGNDLSMLPYEWRPIVNWTIATRARIEFGTVLLDRDLTLKQRLAVEAFQAAFVEKRNRDRARS